MPKVGIFATKDQWYTMGIQRYTKDQWYTMGDNANTAGDMQLTEHFCITIVNELAL